MPRGDVSDFDLNILMRLSLLPFHDFTSSAPWLILDHWPKMLIGSLTPEMEFWLCLLDEIASFVERFRQLPECLRDVVVHLMGDVSVDSLTFRGSLGNLSLFKFGSRG